MCRGMVLVSPRMWPETTDTAPNSPMARALREDDAVHEAPAHLGQGDAEEGHPAARAEGDGGFLLVVAELLHERNELARDVGKVTNIVARMMPGSAKMMLMS